MFDGLSQACPKHPKYQIRNIFVIVQEERNKCDFFLHEDKHQKFLQAGSTIFTGHSQT